MAVKRIIDLVEDNSPSPDDYVAVDNSSPNSTRRTRVSDLLTEAGPGVFLLPSDIGTTVQAFDAALQSIAGLTTVVDQMIYTTGADSYATTSLTPFARTILDDANASSVRSTIGLDEAWLISLIEAAIPSLPTSLPVSAGKLWNNGGALSIS